MPANISPNPTMRYLRCTKKLLEEMDAQPNSSKSDQNGILGDWYANLLFIERKKCLLFVNEKTRFCFLMPNLKRVHIKNLAVVFRDGLFGALLSEGYQAPMIEHILSEYDSLGYSKATDRAVLGSMTEYAKTYDYWIANEGGLARCDLKAMNKQMNQMFMGMGKPKTYIRGSELLRACYPLVEKALEV
jgi:hypothetical protein